MDPGNEKALDAAHINIAQPETQDEGRGGGSVGGQVSYAGQYVAGAAAVGAAALAAHEYQEEIKDGAVAAYTNGGAFIK